MGEERLVTSRTGNHGAVIAGVAFRAGFEETVIILSTAIDRPWRLPCLRSVETTWFERQPRY